MKKQTEIEKVFNNLTESEKKSFLKRVGIKDISEFNKIDLNKIGKDFAVTQKRIREIEAKAMNLIRKARKKNSNGEPPDDIA